MKRTIAALAALALCLGPALPALADQQEEQIGQQVYAELQQKGEIIQQSPYYSTLNPIAKQIKRVADRQYDRPFTFILVHEKAPNAFAVPGGNVYVTDSLMTFVKNREELAGVLCHETSHTIHHDVIHNMKKDQNLAIGATVLSLLLGGGKNGYVNQGVNMLAGLKANDYSREVETAADLKGSETCAEAGSNPWGMVWLFQQFEKADTGGGMEMLRDHPSDEHRIADLEQHFKANPRLYAHYDPSIVSATPLRTASRISVSKSRVAVR